MHDPGAIRYLGSVRRFLVLVCLAACPHAAPPPSAPAPTTGGIAGEVRARDTGEPVRATLTAHDQQSFVVETARTGADGGYAIDGLAPGVYDMVVELPGTTLQLTGIPVTAGHTTGFDVPVDIGGVELPPIAFERVEGGDIRVYAPPELEGGDHARVEGTVTDTVSLERVAGAVIVADAPELAEPLTGVSDDRGRFRFPSVPPGTYTLSAFYNVDRRGQIEVRRSEIAVVAGTAVTVPMFVEVSGTQ